MKKLFCFLISALILLSLPLYGLAYDYDLDGRTSLVNDFAGLMHYDDAEILNSKLEQISELYECEIAVLTVNSANGQDITAFADDYYDYNGFGYGEDDDGIMLVVDMGAREYAITTCGKAIYIFDDYSLYLIEEEFVSYLSEGSYTKAFIAYYEKCAQVLNDYYYADDTVNDNFYTDDDYFYGEDYDYIYGGTTSTSSDNIFSLQWIAFSIIGGIVIAFFYTFYLKSQLKTVHSKAAAEDYVVSGSVNITRSHDIFMYRNVRKTPKPKNNSSSSRGSSAGSVHTSSSGRSHGGSRGSF